EHPALLDSINSVEENENDSAYNILQLPAPLQPAETAKEAESKPDPAKKTSPIAAVPEFTLVEFLDHLNSSAEAVKAAATHLSQPVKRKPAQKLNRQPKLEPISENVKVQAKTPEPIAEIVEVIDENFEIEDISDSLVDAIFDDFIGAKIGPTEDDTSTKTPAGQRKEEVSESLVEAIEEGPKVRTEEEIATEESLESEDREKPQGEIKLLPAPAQKEPLQTEKEGTPTETDIETEADSILVESIEDLFSKIKQVHNLTSKKDEPAPEPGQTESEPNVKAAAAPIKTEPESSLVSENEENEIASEPQVEEKTVEFKSEAAEPAEKAEALLVAGVKHYQKKQFEDAIITFRNLLKIEPDSKNIYLLLGNAYFKNGMMTEALSVYEQYKKKYPGESIAHENLALIYEKKDVYQSALKEWKAALDLNHDRPDIKRKIEQAEQALRAETQNGNSVKETQTIATEPPRAMAKPNKQDEQKNTLLKEGIYHYRNKNFAAAINSFKVANKLFPKFKKAYSFLGVTYFRHKMFDESEQIFEKLKQLQFESESEHENMGIIYAKQGFYRLALNEWEKVLTAHPNRTDIKEKIDKVFERL
ncbi:tetratricopeptide repeat protein, partial [candidate division KSB1 bacterium]|nr:tetratricopeptide repeat protein [candidate division KSB1 bacterium]